MELGLVPSQFLSVVLEESDKNCGSSACTTNSLSQNISTSVTISPVVPNKSSTFKKKTNEKYPSSGMKNGVSKFFNGALQRNEYLDLKRRLPQTVLEECIVELADSSSKICNKVPEHIQNAVIIKPMYAKKIRKQQRPQNRREENIDFRDLFAGVEAVYSDDDESSASWIPIERKQNGVPSQNHIDSNTVDVAASSLAYACDHCPNKYSNKGALWQHNVATHSVEKNCECQLCGRKFYRNCSLALHMKSHSDEQNCSCKVCGKEFNRLSALDKHVKCHNAEAAVVVTTTAAASIPVNGSASTAASMNAAVATATVAALASSAATSAVITVSPTAVVTFACKICGKKYPDEVTLQAHVYAHNEKFTCEQCNVTFNTKQLLDLHFLITHKRSETPFACKWCKARFANLRELNEHAASHTSEKVRIPCHHCGEVFTQRCMYKKHVQLHVGERLRCTICGIDFTQRSSLLRHYKRSHLMQDKPNSVPATVVETPNLTIITK